MSIKSALIDHLNKLPDDCNYGSIEEAISKFEEENSLIKKPWSSPASQKVFLYSCVLGVFTLVMVIIGLCFKTKPFLYFDIIAYSSWALFPPIWFFYEYTKIFPDKYKLNENQLNDLKYTHELASKIWAAFVVFLSIIFYVKYKSNIPFLN